MIRQIVEAVSQAARPAGLRGTQNAPVVLASIAA